MSASTLAACEACGWQGRPRRIRCPRCAGTTWVNAPLPDATVIAGTEAGIEAVLAALHGVVAMPL